MNASTILGAAAVAPAMSAYALLTSKPWAWPAAIGAHTLALGGVLLGMAAIAAGRGPHSVLNDTYHRVMVVALLGTLVAMSTLLVRRALGSRSASAG